MYRKRARKETAGSFVFNRREEFPAAFSTAFPESIVLVAADAAAITAWGDTQHRVLPEGPLIDVLLHSLYGESILGRA